MKELKYFLGVAFILTIIAGCKKDTYTDVAFIETATAPDKLAALFDITQDNTGLVTITPNAEGAVYYEIYFGDGTAAPVRVLQGKNIQHRYAEGVFNVKMVSYNISGKSTEVTQKLTVSFKAPENLEFTATIDLSDNFKINVTARALYETVFRVYFGDVPNEIPKSFTEGETISHTYVATGTYNVKVVAFSGGVASTQLQKSITIVDPVLLPVTFESGTVNYSFNNFDGGNVTVVNNPQSGVLNNSTKVAKMVKSAGQPWGGSALPLGAPIDFSANKYFRMLVFSPRVGAKVLLKVENATDGTISFEKEVATTKANAWEDMNFDFSAIDASKRYQNIVLIFDLGTQGDGTANYTFLMDNIRLTNTAPTGTAQVSLPITFDDPNVNYTVTDFGNNQTIDAADPANAANKVKRTTKLPGAETWAGTTMSTPTGFATRIPFTALLTKMSVRVYSPAAGIRVRLKVEDRLDNTKSVETETNTTVANAWETLTFNFSNQAAGTAAINLATNYNMASIFFDFGTAGSGKIFFWDDANFVTTSSSPTDIALPLNFETAGITFAYTNFDGGGTTVINNPKAGGINTSAKVGQMIKSAGQPWGGSWIALTNPISFATTKTFKVKVYSPRVGAKLLFKVENLTDGAINSEREVATTKANEWEELTFDFNSIDATKSYQKIVMIFDLGTQGDGSANYTFLFDDITLN